MTQSILEVPTFVLEELLNQIKKTPAKYAGYELVSITKLSSGNAPNEKLYRMIFKHNEQFYETNYLCRRVGRRLERSVSDDIITRCFLVRPLHNQFGGISHMEFIAI